MRAWRTIHLFSLSHPICVDFGVRCQAIHAQFTTNITSERGTDVNNIPAQVGQFTARFISDEESSMVAGILEILPSFISWVCNKSEQAEQYSDGVNICLDHIRKWPGISRNDLLHQILDSTCIKEFYLRKGLDEMHAETFGSWLKSVWKGSAEVNEETKGATMEVFRRGGDPVIEEYRSAISTVQVEFEKAVEHVRLAELNGGLDFDKGRYDHL